MAVRVRRVRKRVRHAVTPIRVLFTLTVVSLCMVLLYNQMHLTRLTKEIGEKQTELDEFAERVCFAQDPAGTGAQHQLCGRICTGYAWDGQARPAPRLNTLS